MLITVFLIQAGAQTRSAPAARSVQRTPVIINDSTLFAALRVRNPLSGDFYAGVPFLWFKKDAQGHPYPGNGVIRSSDNKGLFQQFDNIEISLLNNARYAKDDLIDIYRSIRFVSFKGDNANLVRRIGRGKITRVEKDRVSAQIIQMWDVIKENDRIDKVQQFPSREPGSFDEVENRIAAEVVLRVEETVIPYLHQSVIIDKGSDQGVQPGYVFLVNSPIEKNTTEPSILGYAAHVDRTYSTLVILQMYGTRLKPGDQAIAVRKTRFEQE
jgi:hypothetical protein